MDSSDILLRPGTLRPAIEDTRRTAMRSGALESIATAQEIVEQQGVRFVVRQASGLRRKARQKIRDREERRSGRSVRNPFLPPDPALTVAGLSTTHLAVLNKFNVIDRHLLMVTRRFEHQEALLTREDFLAFWICLAEIDGLGFYNGGETAGASQPHKHLQIIPLPLSDGGPGMPMDAFFDRLSSPGKITRLPSLPWDHRCSRLDPGLATDPVSAAEQTHRSYRSMLGALNIHAVGTGADARQSGPYNLLITRSLLALIPRSRERAGGISVNALGFAGSLFVPDEGQVRTIRKAGPMNLLASVGRRARRS